MGVGWVAHRAVLTLCGERAYEQRSSPERVANAKPSKAREVAVRGQELATVLYGQRRVISICNQLAARASGRAQAHEDVPAAGPVSEGSGVASPSELGHEAERIVKTRGLLPNFRIGDDSHESAAAEIGNGVGFITFCEGSQPLRIARVVRGFSPVRVDENVDVRNQHGATCLGCRAQRGLLRPSRMRFR
jgi:hypothetical protein